MCMGGMTRKLALTRDKGDKLSKSIQVPPMFLISSYGTPLAQSFLFGTAQFSLWASGAVNYYYIVANSINS